jgi:hypothetical protein
MDKSNNDNLNFEDLKGLWQSSLDSQAINDPSFDNHKILTIMQEKTSSAVQKIRRNLMIDILVTIPLIIGGYFLFEKRGIHFPILFWVGLILFSISYHVYLYWKLQKQAVSIANVHETINEQRAKLLGFIKMYDIFAIVGGIVFCLASGSFFHANYHKDTFILIPLMLFSLSAGYGFYTFTRWYAQKIYGQYYSILDESKKALEQE